MTTALLLKHNCAVFLFLEISLGKGDMDMMEIKAIIRRECLNALKDGLAE